jgi:UDP-N-acetylmuramate--alanine ligase
VLALGGDAAAAARALGEFTGVGRRFDRLGEFGGVAIVDDYAHHPTEIRATLAAARQAFPLRRIVAAFQPHLFSRTALHHEEMGSALGLADFAIVTDVYPAREQPMPGITGVLVADAARRHGVTTVYQPARADLARTTLAALAPGDVLLTLGAGDITHLGRELRPMLEPE